MQKKKILFVITKSKPFGGAQKYVYDIATSLPQDRFEVVVALGGDGGLKEKLETHTIRTISLNQLQRDVALTKDIRAFRELFDLFKKERPDSVHLNSSKAGGIGALAARLTRIPNIIFTAHGLVFEEDRGLVAQFVIRFLSWITFLLCHTTIVISKKDKTRVLGLAGTSQKNVVLIHNGIGHIEFLDRTDAREHLAQNYSIPTSGETLWVGTISELHSNKGLEYMVEGFADFVKEYPTSICIIIGEGEERQHLTDLIEKYELENHVFLLGEVSDAAKYLRALDIFTLTSVKEGHPYVLLEAGLAKLPVIATHVAGIADVIQDMRSGILIRPKDPTEITRALLYLVNHPDKQTQFKNALYEHVSTTYTLDTMMTQTRALYEKE